MTLSTLPLRALLAASGMALLTLPGAASAQGLALSRSTTAPAGEPEVLEVISLRNPCDEGTAFFHEYGTSVMTQYGYRSCPIPLF
jgi:hypothetical protein